MRESCRERKIETTVKRKGEGRKESGVRRTVEGRDVSRNGRRM